MISFVIIYYYKTKSKLLIINKFTLNNSAYVIFEAISIMLKDLICVFNKNGNIFTNNYL